MNRRFARLALSGAIGLGLFVLQAQQPGNSRPAGQAPPTADPYANNPDAVSYTHLTLPTILRV